jgi:hypothetical protein
MRKPVKVLIIYLISLLVFSLIFSWMGFENFATNTAIPRSSFSPLMVVTIIGGMVALKYSVSGRSLKIFLIIYGCLWILRCILLLLGNQIGEAYIFNRKFHFDLIISTYFENVSRLNTPLPFIIYWFINNLFSKQDDNVEVIKKIDS